MLQCIHQIQCVATFSQRPTWSYSHMPFLLIEWYVRRTYARYTYFIQWRNGVMAQSTTNWCTIVAAHWSIPFKRMCVCERASSHLGICLILCVCVCCLSMCGKPHHLCDFILSIASMFVLHSVPNLLLRCRCTAVLLPNCVKCNFLS